jgi:hypothetical protein
MHVEVLADFLLSTSPRAANLDHLGPHTVA